VSDTQRGGYHQAPEMDAQVTQNVGRRHEILTSPGDEQRRPADCWLDSN